MARSFDEKLAGIGYGTLSPLPGAQRDSLISELLENPSVRAQAEACAFNDAGIRPLSAAVESVLERKNLKLNGLEFFNLVVETWKRVGRGG